MSLSPLSTYIHPSTPTHYKPTQPQNSPNKQTNHTRAARTRLLGDLVQVLRPQHEVPDQQNQRHLGRPDVEEARVEHLERAGAVAAAAAGVGEGEALVGRGEEEAAAADGGGVPVGVGLCRVRV